MHHHARNNLFKKLKLMVHLKTRGAIPELPLTKYKIVCTRFTIRPLDPFDNLPGSFKPIIDALTELSIIEDDRWGMGEMISCRQVKVKKKCDQKIMVEVQSVRE